MHIYMVHTATGYRYLANMTTGKAQVRPMMQITCVYVDIGPPQSGEPRGTSWELPRIFLTVQTRTNYREKGIAPLFTSEFLAITGEVNATHREIRGYI
jgi:hypothetical protein